MFTSVPIADATNVIKQLIQEDEDFSTRTNLKPESLLDLLQLCLTRTSFQFRETHYEPTDGLPMGSPTSLSVANLFVAQLEKKALNSFQHVRPKIWLSFVDDVFSILKKSSVNALLQHLNSQCTSITFTIEEEHNNRLSFMDATVHRYGRHLKTSVFRKPTHTGRYLDFSSHHPENAKRAVVCALAQRIKYVTIGEQERKEEEKQICLELTKNGYPRKLL